VQVVAGASSSMSSARLGARPRSDSSTVPIRWWR
jgi:hypothetical protein